MAQEMYHLNGPNGPNGPTPGPAGRYGGAPHGPPSGPSGGPPQGYPHGHSAAPSGLPRNMNPVDMRGGPAIQISDVTQDLLSESDMKEELSEFVVFRFEKMVDKEGFDDQGQLKRPSWEKVIRSEDRSISKQAATQKVRQLNQSTKTVLDKKNSLMTPLKLQLDKTLEYLMSQELDHTHYHWILVQMDHQLIPIVPYPYNGSYDYPTSTEKHHLSSSSKRKSRSRTRGHHKKKRSYERISLTAYFQRVPRQGVDIHGLWRDKKRGLGGIHRSQPVAINNAFPPTQHPHNQFQGQQPQQHQHQQHQQHQQQHGGREQGPPPARNPQGAQPQGPPRPSGPHQSGPHPPGPRPPGQHPSGAHPPPQNRPVPHGPHKLNNGQGPRQNPNQGQGQGQRRERHSGFDSDSESDSRSSRESTRTPPSSVSDHRSGHHHAPNPAARPYTHGLRPEQPGDNHRTNGNPGQPRASRSPHRPPHAPARPHPLSTEGGSVATHIERVREEAYRRGRLAERQDALLAEDLAFPGAHAAPRMYGMRGDVKEEAVRRYLAELSVYDDDDAADGVEFRRGDARHRREYETRVQRGSILQDDPFESSTTVPSSYAYSTDGRARGRGRPIVSIPGRRPLSPVGPRRIVSYY